MEVRFGYSMVKYAGNGSTNLWALTFPYLQKGDIVADIYDNVTQLPTATGYSWINDSTIAFNTVPSPTQYVLIERRSGGGARVDFTSGATITEADLDLAHRQALYTAEEAMDNAGVLQVSVSDLEEQAGLAQAAATLANTAAGSAMAQASLAGSSASTALAAATSAADSAAAAAASALEAAEAAAGDWAVKMDKSANLSDVANAATARSNLGLGTMAVEAAADYLPKSGNLLGLADTAIARTNLGLSNVDNTSDANKPVSTATQTALNAKLNAASNLSDLNSAPTARTNLGLGNVNNTSDANKPVSTAQQAALDAKAPLVAPVFSGPVRLGGGGTSGNGWWESGGASPVSVRHVWGTDGTGWDYRIAKRVSGGAAVDLVRVSEGGDVQLIQGGAKFFLDSTNRYGMGVFNVEGTDGNTALFTNAAYGGRAISGGKWDGSTYTPWYHVTDNRAKFNVPVVGKGGTIGHHVEAYGAAGDGVTDDTAAIQAAFTAAAAGTGGSSEVIFGAKTYKQNSTAAIALNATHITVRGQGSDGGAKTVIHAAAGVTPFAFTSAFNLNDAGSRSQVCLRDLAFTTVGVLGTLTVTGATNASPIRVTTATTHNRATGDAVLVSNVGGNTAANGYWTVTVIDGITLDLQNSTGNGAFTTGGTVLPLVPAISMGSHGKQIDSLTFHEIDNVFVHNYALGVKLLNVRKVDFDKVTLRHEALSGGLALYAMGQSSCFSGEYVFKNCDLSTKYDANPQSVAVLLEETRGAKFFGTWFYFGGWAGLYAVQRRAGGESGDIAVIGSQADFGSGTGGSSGFRFDCVSGKMSNVRVADCYTFGYANGVVASGLASFRHFSARGNFLADHVENGIVVNGVEGSSVIGNTFRHIGHSGVSNDAAVVVNGASKYATVLGNTHVAEGSTNIDYLVKFEGGVTHSVAHDNTGDAVKGHLLDQRTPPTITAASTITAPSMTQRRYGVLGSTTINLITKTGWGHGDRLTFYFNAAVTVSHNVAPSGDGAPIYLAGSANFSATQFDTLAVEWDANASVWVEVARTVI